MSTNCIKCGVNKRTKSDLLCDACRETRTSSRRMLPSLEWAAPDAKHVSTMSIQLDPSGRVIAFGFEAVGDNAYASDMAVLNVAKAASGAQDHQGACSHE